MIATMKGCNGKRKQETANEDGRFKFMVEHGKNVKPVRGTQVRKDKAREILNLDSSGRFVKKELEAVENLLEFSRKVQSLAKDTALEWTREFQLTWGIKKRRSILFSKGDIEPAVEGVGEVANSAFVAPKLEASGDKNLRNVKHTEVKTVSLESSNKFSFTCSRTESPNSPFPVLKAGYFRNDGLIVPKVEEETLPGTFQLASTLSVDITQPSCLISCKVEKDAQVRIANHERAFLSKAVKSCRQISGFKRDNALEDLDLPIMCKQSIENGVSELEARCENKYIYLQKFLKVKAKPELSFASAFSDLWVNQDLGRRYSDKQKLLFNENEKEIRRLHRIQVNRESARQTIRRKQILSEELVKRVTKLRVLNENLKQERAVLKQDIQSLYDANCVLNQQCATTDIQGNYEVLSQPSTDALPPSSPTMHVPDVPLVRLPYQVYPWALSLTRAGAMKCSPFQAGEEVPSPEKSTCPLAFGFWLSMGANRHMQMPFSSPSHSTSEQSKSGSPLSPLPVNIVGLSLAGGGVENTINSSFCQGVDDAEPAHVDISSQEQKMRPEQAPQFLSSVSLVTDTEVENIIIQVSALQSGPKWQLTGSLPLDLHTRTITPFCRQVGLEKGFPILEKGDILQGHRRHISHFFARRDGVAITKAAEARRIRKKITRNKSLLRQSFQKV